MEKKPANGALVWRRVHAPLVGTDIGDERVDEHASTDSAFL
jgi:hypothetical protein